MSQIYSIGFLELNSIARGIECVDAMLKVANSKLIMAKASCPGKYYAMVTGEVSAVERSIDTGKNIGTQHVVGELVIPRVHPEVIRAVNMSHIPDNISAIGVIEYYSAAGSIIAADYAVKAADVELISIQLGTGIAGKSFVVLTGDVSAVNAAVEAGIEGAKEEAILINKVVLSNPDQALIDSLIQ